jgi:hypothetical protein
MGPLVYGQLVAQCDELGLQHSLTAKRGEAGIKRY